MASISADTFTWGGLECTYNDGNNRIIMHRRGKGRRWLTMHRGRIDECWFQPTPADDITNPNPLIIELPKKMAFALWLAAEREGLLDPDLPTTHPP